jgi:hypothetical protein
MNDHDIKHQLEELKKRYIEHQNFEYTYDHGYGRNTVILGNQFRSINNQRTIFENYPLADIWEQWFLQSKLTSFDLFLLTNLENCPVETFKKLTKNDILYSNDFIPHLTTSQYGLNPIKEILKILSYKYKVEQEVINDFCIYYIT